MSSEKTEAVARKIGRQTAAGAVVLVALRLATRSIDLVSLVVLGRLLSPADFGLVAIAMSVMMVFEAVMELPVFFALVAIKNRTRAHYDTAFTLLTIKGALLSTMLLLVAWPVAYVYNDERLIWLILSLGLAPVSRGLGSPRMIDHSANFNFWPNFVMETSGKLVGFVLAVSLAWSTRSYWALPAGTIAVPITASAISYLFAPYRPRFALAEWRAFGSFLGWTSVTQAVAATNWQMDQLILGHWVDRFELGRFAMASNLASIPWQIFIVQVISPLLVAFSQVRENAARLRGAYRKSVATIVTVGLPIMVGMSLTAGPIVQLILGDQWSEAGAMLRWLALVAVPSLFVAPLSPLSMALNQTRVLLWLAVAELALKLPLTLLGVYFDGIEGVLLVRLTVSAAVAICSMVAARDLIKLPVMDQLLSSWRAVLGAAAMAVAVVPLQLWLGAAGTTVAKVTYLAVTIAAGGGVYVGSVFLLWRLSGMPEGIEADAIGAAGALLRKLSRSAPA